MERADQPLSVDPRTREESRKIYQLNRNYDVLVGNRLIVGAPRPERAPRNPKKKMKEGRIIGPPSYWHVLSICDVSFFLSHSTTISYVIPAATMITEGRLWSPEGKREGRIDGLFP